MNHQPATQLPSNDEPWWATVEEFTERETALVRVLDWAGIERLASEYFDRAESAYAAALFSHSRAIALSALGRQAESLAADELAEHLAPIDPYFKLHIAQRLIAEYGRPEDGLAKLTEAEPLVEPDMRAGWLSEQGLGLLAVGRDAEAVECFRELARPERLARIRSWDHIWLVDLRLVSALIKKHLVPELCVAYLEAAAAIGARDPKGLDLVQKLLEQVTR
jgi:hypothetical protein